MPKELVFQMVEAVSAKLREPIAWADARDKHQHSLVA